MQAFIPKADLEKLADIIREVTGNKMQESNFRMIESRLKGRMARLGFTTMEHYWKHFHKNEGEEKTALQSLMTTHFTFFFREHLHFEMLEKWIEENQVQLKRRFFTSGEPVKIFSAACSRGQEVYSLAAFFETHLFKKYGVEFQVLGMDLDQESVAFAENAVYPLKEVNTIPLIYLTGNFKKGTGPIKEFAAVSDRLKAKTEFKVGNLLELNAVVANQKFDIIFCRNVFIYFTEDKVKQIATNLAELLNEDGLFVSGISEPIRFSGWPYPQYGPSGYQKSSIKATDVIPVSANLTAGDNIKTITVLKKPEPILQKYKVLCVDDSTTIHTLMKKILSQDTNCVEIDFAFDGADARAKLDSNKYDVVTLDIHMPKVGGIEFLERLYNKYTDPPVLMVSTVNRTDADLATKALSLGAFDYVEKPEMNRLQSSSDEIMTKIRMALRQRTILSNAGMKDYDASIGTKIVVPDASKCLRIVMASTSNLFALEHLLQGQEKELRSPPMLIAWPESEPVSKLEEKILECASRPVQVLKNSTTLLKPGWIYIVDHHLFASLAAKFSFNQISLQVLDAKVPELGALKQFSQVQILIDESISLSATSFEKKHGMTVNDVLPALSFSSVSVEFFANMRKKIA